MLQYGLGDFGMEIKSAPSINEYLNVNLYLEDYYHFRKSQPEGFSYESWAQALGVSSKSFLRFAILGKRTISEELAHKLALFIGLNEKETEYFYLLVLYTQASQAEVKRTYEKKLIQTLRGEIEWESVRPPANLLESPLYFEIRNVLVFEGSPRTPEGLADLLSVSAEEVMGHLEELKNQGFVKCEDGSWSACQSLIRINQGGSNQAQLAYHKKSLEKAIEAQSLSAETRHYLSLSLPVTEEEYKDCIHEVDQLFNSLYGKYAKDNVKGSRFYQMNFNLIPWTKKVE